MQDKLLIIYCFQIFSILSVLGNGIHYWSFMYKAEQFLVDHYVQVLSAQYVNSYWRKSGHLIYPYYKLTWKDARPVWRSHKTTVCIGMECLMVAWVFFYWRVGRCPIWLRLTLLHWPKWGCSKAQLLMAQTCVKTLEIFNERTQSPAPWWHAVVTDLHPDLWWLVCQGAAGAGCSSAARTAPQHPHEASRTGTVAVAGDSHGSAVTLTQLFSQELIQGWHHHRAGWGQPDSSVQGEDCRACWGPWCQQLVNTNDDRLKLLEWRLNSSRMLFSFIRPAGSPCVRIRSL